MKITYTLKATDPDMSDRLDYLEAMATGYFLIILGTVIFFGMKATGMI